MKNSCFSPKGSTTATVTSENKQKYVKRVRKGGISGVFGRAGAQKGRHCPQHMLTLVKHFPQHLMLTLAKHCAQHFAQHLMLTRVKHCPQLLLLHCPQHMFTLAKHCP